MLNCPARMISYNEKSWLYAKNEKFSLIYIVIFHNKPEFFIISHFSLYDLLLLALQQAPGLSENDAVSIDHLPGLKSLKMRVRHWGTAPNVVKGKSC